MPFKWLICDDCKKRAMRSEVYKIAEECPKCQSQNTRYSDQWWIKVVKNTKQVMKPVSVVKKKAALAEARLRSESDIFVDILNKEKTCKLTFEDLVDEYKIYCKKQRGYEKSKRYIIDIIKDRFAGIHPDALTALDLDRLYREQLEKNSSYSANRYIDYLKAMYRQGVRWEMVSKKTLGIFEGLAREKEAARLRWITEEERDRLVIECGKRKQSKHLKTAVILAVHAGLRKGEVLGLTWDRVDLDNRLIWLFSADQKNKEMDSIPMNSVVVDALTSISKHNGSRYVLCRPDGTRFNDIKTAFNSAVKKTKINDFSFHDLRHTFASLLVQKGETLPTVMKLMRHKSIKMTLRYTHLAPTHTASAVARLEPSKKISQEEVRKEVRIDNEDKK